MMDLIRRLAAFSKSRLRYSQSSNLMDRYSLSPFNGPISFSSTLASSRPVVLIWPKEVQQTSQIKSATDLRICIWLKIAPCCDDNTHCCHQMFSMQIKKAGQPLFLRLLSFATKATNCLIQNTGKTLSLKLVGLARVDTTARGRYLGNAH